MWFRNQTDLWLEICSKKSLFFNFPSVKKSHFAVIFSEKKKLFFKFEFENVFFIFEIFFFQNKL